MPSGTPTSDRQAEADRARAAASPRCSGSSARSLQQRLGSCGTPRAGSAGCTGEIEPLLGRRRRASPATRASRTSSHAASADEPPRHRAAAARAARTSAGLDGARHLLGGRRRLRRVDLDLDAAVLRVVVRIGRIGRPIPAHARRSRTGSAGASGTSRTSASFTALARLSDSSCTRLFGTWPFIEPSVCPSMTMRAAPNWPASLPISSTHEVDVRIVELLDVLAVDRAA